MLIMPSPLKLSVLDQSPAAQDKTQDHAIRESLALAKHCDALGYHRYWISEHHNSASIVGTAPGVLMAAIAATTQRIRVGSAGVMLPHYSTLKVPAVLAGDRRDLQERGTLVAPGQALMLATWYGVRQGQRTTAQRRSSARIASDNGKASTKYMRPATR